MRALENTSFDRYARYSYIFRLRETCFGADPVTVLDVGDPYGTLAPLFPNDRTVSLDLYAEGPPTAGGHVHALGSGFELPFPAATFDIAATHDVYEHLPDGRRADFVDELLRVTRGPAVIAAPFADPRTARCEAIVNAYYVARTGRTLEPLDEHVEDGGLPDLGRLTGRLDELGVPYRVESGGWLYHWLAFMLLKAHFVAEGRADLDRAVDTAFNARLRERDDRAPHYRRVVLVNPPDGLAPAAGAVDDGDVNSQLVDLTELGWELVACLDGGSDPTTRTAALGGWIAGHRDGSGDRAELARSLELVMQAAGDTLGELHRVGRRVQRQPSVAAILHAGADPVRLRHALGRLTAQQPGPTEVLVVADDAGGLEWVDTEPGARLLVDPTPDRLLRLNHAVEQVGTDAILLLDPAVEIPDDFVAGLLAAYRPEDGASCVAAIVEGLPRLAPEDAFGEDGGDVLYARRAAMLIDRALYRNVGGFDGQFEEVLDDLDLGWRLNLLGYHVPAAPVVCRWTAEPPPAPRPEQLERSLLLALLRNVGDRTLGAVLGPELLALTAYGSERASSAVGPIVSNIGGIMATRATLLSQRRRSDEEIFDRFGRPGARPGTAADPLYRAFGLRPPGKGDRPTIVAVTSDPGGRIARLAAVLTAYGEVEIVEPGIDLAAAGADVVLTSIDLAHRHPELLATGGPVVVDVSEASVPDGLIGRQDAALRADFVVCETEQQRDHWLGRLAATGHLGAAPADDPGYRRSIDTVPEPVPAAPPVLGRKGGTIVAVDVAGLAEDVGLGCRTVERLAAELEPTLVDRIVVLDAGDGAAGRVLATVRPVGRVPVVGTAGTDRMKVLTGAALAVRPSGDSLRTRLGPTRPASDALAAGVPLVVSRHDPLAPLVEATGAGAAVAGDAAGLSAAVRALLARPDVLAAAQVGTEMARSRCAWPHAAEPLVRAVTIGAARYGRVRYPLPPAPEQPPPAPAPHAAPDAPIQAAGRGQAAEPGAAGVTLSRAVRKARRLVAQIVNGRT